MKKIAALLILTALSYWAWSINRAKVELDDNQAAIYFGYCIAFANGEHSQISRASQVSRASQINGCRRFYEEYLPAKTIGYQPGTGTSPKIPFRDQDVSSVYAGVNQQLATLKQPLLKPINKLSNGWLVP